MIFYNPTLDSFSTSADYYLDRQRTVAEEFPSLRYDGGLTTSVWSSNRVDAPSKYVTGDSVFVYDDDCNISAGTIITPPTSRSPWYSIQLEDKSVINCRAENIYTDTTIPSTGLPTETLGFFVPDWMWQGARVTCLVDDRYEHGYLNISKDHFWEFVT